MLRRVSKWFVRFFAFTGFMTLLSSLALMVFLATLKPKEHKLAEEAILYLDFAKPIRAVPQNDPFAAILEPESIDLFSLTEAIRRAATDKRVKGLVADVSFASVDMASAQEIHEALAVFRKSGKFTIAFADTFGEGGNSTGQYYLAAGFGKIWMQPSGMVGLIGVGAELPFFRKTLDWAGVKADFIRHNDYKTAMNMLTEEGLTLAHREQMQDLLKNMFLELQRGITANRKLPESLLTLVNKGPFLAKEALQHKLVDNLGYRDEVEKLAEKTLKTVSPDDAWFGIAEYQHLLKKESFDGMAKLDGKEKQARLAMVYINGAIMRGAGNSGGGQDGTVIATDIADALHQATKDDSVKAIVLRVDSPGGSYTASDTIRRAVLKAKAAKKPVIVSMGSVAASGGYYVAMEGDTILANPATITGSIGVFGGKFVVDGLAGKAKVSTEKLQIGQNALMWSPLAPFEGAGREAFQRSLDFVFDDFRASVGKARKLSPEVVDSVSGGRIFTGRQAEGNKLVDKTGSLRQAVVLAKEKMGFKADDLVPVVVFPEAKSPADRLKALLGGGIHQNASLGVRLQALWQALRMAVLPGGMTEGVQMRMEPVTLVY